MSRGHVGVYAAPAAAAPTPWMAWAAAALLSALVGASITSPKIAVAMVGTLAAGAALRSVLAQPVRGFVLALAIFPFYTLARGTALSLGLPLPFAVLGLWPEAILSMMLAGVACAAIRDKRRLRLTWNDLPVTVLLGGTLYGLVLTLLERDLSAAVYGFHSSATAFLFYFVARWLRPAPRDLERVLRAWLVGFAVLALASLADYVLRPEFFIRIAMQMRPDYHKTWEPFMFYRWYPRMQSLMFAEQMWGTLCGAVSLFCLAATGMAEARRPRWATPLFALATLGLGLSMSRGALIGWLVGVLVLSLCRGRHRRYVVVLLLVATFGAGAALAVFQSQPRVQSLVKRLASLADPNDRLAYDRVDQWRQSLEVFPLFPSGQGLGRAGRAAITHGLGGGEGLVVDGGYFSVLSEQGALGVLLFVLGGGGVLFVLVRTLPRAQGIDRALCLALLALFCGLLVQNVGGNLFDAFFIPHLFWMLLGLLLSRRDAGIADTNE